MALGRASAEAGLKLLRDFTAKFALKDNFRDSLNDILTLAVADTSPSVRDTDDGLLARFASSHALVPVNRTDLQISVDFTAAAEPRRKSRGAKGLRYVNHGWRVRR